MAWDNAYLKKIYTHKIFAGLNDYPRLANSIMMGAMHVDQKHPMCASAAGYWSEMLIHSDYEIKSHLLTINSRLILIICSEDGEDVKQWAGNTPTYCSLYATNKALYHDKLANSLLLGCDTFYSGDFEPVPEGSGGAERITARDKQYINMIRAQWEFGLSPPQAK